MKKVAVVFLSMIFLAMIILSGCGKKMTEQQYYDQAFDYEQNEDFEKAAEYYMMLYKRYPTGQYGAESLFKAALIQANQLKEYDRAIETHERLIRAFPDSKYVQQSQFMIGFIYANDKKDYDKAREVYNEFLQKYPDNELASSVKWELDNLGKDINEIKFMTDEKPDSSATK